MATAVWTSNTSLKLIAVTEQLVSEGRPACVTRGFKKLEGAHHVLFVAAFSKNRRFLICLLLY